MKNILIILILLPLLSFSQVGINNNTLLINNGGSQTPLEIEQSYLGIQQIRFRNTNSGSATVVGTIIRMENDNDYWGAIGMTNSGTTLKGGIYANTYQNYNQGYGDFLFTNDGNVNFQWYADETDSHNFTALNKLSIMQLSPTGNLLLRRANEDTLYYVKDSIWEDLRVSANTFRLGLVRPPDFESYRDGVRTFAFDDSQDEQIYFNIQIPHSWKIGSNVCPHIHWSPGNNTNTGSVVWGLEYTLSDIGGTFGPTDTIWVADPGNGVAYQHQLAGLPEIDMSSITNVSSMFICRLLRDGDGSGGSGLTDDFTGDAFILEFDMHFQKDSGGSDKESSKSF